MVPLSRSLAAFINRWHLGLESPPKRDRCGFRIISNDMPHCDVSKRYQVRLQTAKGGGNTITERTNRLSPIFRAPSITLVATLLTLLNFLIPFAALHLLVRLATGQRMPASKVTTQLISSPAVVASCLAMGADEMCAIEDLDEACTCHLLAVLMTQSADAVVQSCTSSEAGSPCISRPARPMAGSEATSAFLPSRPRWTRASSQGTSGRGGIFVSGAWCTPFA